MIEIRPDKDRPHGGFAEILVPGIAEAPDVAVYNSFLRKWLGPDGWQPNRHGFAPRQVATDGDGLRLIVGPDVVNQIEEDTPIQIDIAGQTWDTYWPDNINHGPDVALEGDLAGTGEKAAAAAPKTMVKRPEPEPEPDPVPAPDPDPDPEPEVKGDLSGTVETDTDVIEPDEAEPPRKKSMGGAIMWVAALVPILVGVAWFLLQTQEPSGSSTEPRVTSVPRIDPICDAEKLTALADQGFSQLADQIRSCGSKVSPDDALGHIERAAAANDGDALALFGALYDKNVPEEAIKEKIGLSFGDDPARAAEYYARGVEAGSSEAGERLTAICRRLLLLSDTLSQSAHDDYCQ